MRPGVTDDAIHAAEARLGVRFPEDYRASLRIHDGQDEDPTVWWLPSAIRLGPLESLVRCWEGDRQAWDVDPEGRMDWLDKSKRVRQVHYHPRQIPIAGSTYWDYDRLLLDYIPGPAGHEGQIIARQDIYLELLCGSFGELLEKIARGLERGTIGIGPRVDDHVEMEFLSPRSRKPIRVSKYFA